MSDADIYFPIFSKTIHTVLKIFSQHDLRKRLKVTVKKDRLLEFLAKIFG